MRKTTGESQWQTAVVQMLSRTESLGSVAGYDEPADAAWDE